MVYDNAKIVKFLAKKSLVSIKNRQISRRNEFKGWLKIAKSTHKNAFLQKGYIFSQTWQGTIRKRGQIRAFFRVTFTRVVSIITVDNAAAAGLLLLRGFIFYCKLYMALKALSQSKCALWPKFKAQNVQS